MSFTKRLSVPIGLAAIVALVVAFGPSLLATARSGLPEISAKQLIAKTASSHVDGLSGVVEARSELGLPQLPGSQGSGHHASGVAPKDLLTGTHTLRVATAGPGKHRVELLGELSQYTLVHNGREAWAYDSADKTAVHWSMPEKAYGKLQRHVASSKTASMTPPRLAQHFLDEVGPSTKVDVQGTDQVAGRDVYTLTLVPHSAKSLIGQVEMFVDAKTWTPLRVTVTPRDGGDPAVDVGFREVSFGAPPASQFAFSPPDGAKVKQKTSRPHAAGPYRRSQPHNDHGTQRDSVGPRGDATHGGPDVIGEGWSSVLAFDHAPSGKTARWLARTGTPVSGDFGDGRMITTRLVTALVTDDGHAYVGAVTPSVLEQVAARGGS